MDECGHCEGTGWTEEGWKNRDESKDPFEGDCPFCDGKGVIPIVD